MKVLPFTWTYMKDTPFEKKAFFLDREMEFPDSGIVGIMGETGSGKSTFCRVLSGLYDPGFAVSSLALGSECGFLFQQPEHQIFAPTFQEELEFALRNFQVPPSLWEKKIKRALQLSGLCESFLTRDPLRLSGGEKRRVALASILVYEPSVLFLDEPFAGLDGESKKILRETIREYSKEHLIFWISHHVEDLLLYAKKILLCKEGIVLDYDESFLVLDRHFSHPLLDLYRSYGGTLPVLWREKVKKNYESI